jgi:hypothetical protein
MSDFDKYYSDFDKYYNFAFRDDLLDVVSARPPLHEHGVGEITLQPLTISFSNPIVRRWIDERRMLFAAALFLTILADQVCYTYLQGRLPTISRFDALPEMARRLSWRLQLARSPSARTHEHGPTRWPARRVRRPSFSRVP